MKKLMLGALLVGVYSLPNMVHAAIGDYKVILVHGFQSSQLKIKPNKEQVNADGNDYWKLYWSQYADARIDWPSHERVEGKISSDYVWPKLQELSKNNICQPGCIFVTHSTGDLVTRYILDNQKNWLTNAGLQPLNIVATFDFAGAGGGSELADIISNIVEGGGSVNTAMRYAISLWLGIEPTKDNTGVLNDLRVATARQIARLSEHRIPRIRFIGNGTDYYKMTSPFLPGNDDGVVAAHSSCGAAQAGEYSSCSASIAMDGKVSPQSKGVTSFMPEHYPMIMGDGYSHTGLIRAEHKGKLTSSINQVKLLNGSTVAVNTYEYKGWFGSKYLYVTDSDKRTISEIVSALN